MSDETLTRKSATELANLIKARAVSPVEVLDAHLATIERVNPKLNAIVTLAADTARAAAREAEAAVMRGEPTGPLHGLPVANSGVLVLARMMAPADLSRRTTSASSSGTWSL